VHLLTVSQIGQAIQTFDPEAGDYPSGFKHDVTLIEPVDADTIVDFQVPINDLGWLSDEGKVGLLGGTRALHVLCDTYRNVVTLPELGPRECLVSSPTGSLGSC